MSFIQNQDVKSLSELIALGADKYSLIHDKDIWVTANGINKTLFNAIKDGDIGTGTGVDTAYREIAYKNDLTSQKISGFMFADNHTTVTLSFNFNEDDMFSVYINGKYYSEYVNQFITPDRYFQKVGNNQIVIFGDVREEDITIELHPLISVHPLLKTMYLSLTLKFESYVQNTLLINATSVSGAEISLIKEVDKTDITLLFLNGNLVPNSNYKIHGDKLTLESPLLSADTLVLHVFVNSALKAPYITSELKIQNDAGTILKISASNEGLIELEDGQDGYFDDLVFNYNGILYRIGATENNELYIETSNANLVLNELVLESPDLSKWVVCFDSNQLLALKRISHGRTLTFKDEQKILYELSSSYVRLNQNLNEGEKFGSTNPFVFHEYKKRSIVKEFSKSVSIESPVLESDKFSKTEIYFDSVQQNWGGGTMLWDRTKDGFTRATFLFLGKYNLSHHTYQMPGLSGNWIWQRYSRTYLNLTGSDDSGISLSPYWYWWYRTNIENGFATGSGTCSWGYITAYTKLASMTQRLK